MLPTDEDLRYGPTAGAKNHLALSFGVDRYVNLLE